MIWPITLTHSVSFSRSISSPDEAILKILHDPSTLLDLNPLVSDKLANLTSPSVYTVTERLSFFKYFHTTTTFQCTIINRDDGVDTEVIAGCGTRIQNHFTVKRGQSGLTEVSEQATLEGIFFLMPYIVGTMKEAHRGIFENLANKTEMVPGRQSVTLISTPPPTPLRVVVPVVFLSFGIYVLRFGATMVQIIALTVVVGLTLLIAPRLAMATDPYGLFHLRLNKLPDEDPNAPPKTEWLNMGFWKSTSIFPHACAALAFKLIRAARCKSGGKVLDVGHGTGESLILLLSDPSAPCPSNLTGITSLAAHRRRSQDRVAQLQASLKDSRTEVNLYEGDAVYQSPAPNNHPLHPSSAVYFDTIFALDCAYHFNTRNAFLHQAFHKLAPTGRIALADICFDPLALRSIRTRLVASLLRLIPKQNMISPEDYVSEMSRIGYVDVQLEDITKDVFPGFVAFLKERGWRWWLFGMMVEWWCTNTGAQFVIVAGSKA